MRVFDDIADCIEIFDAYRNQICDSPNSLWFSVLDAIHFVRVGVIAYIILKGVVPITNIYCVWILKNYGVFILMLIFIFSTFEEVNSGNIYYFVRKQLYTSSSYGPELGPWVRLFFHVLKFVVVTHSMQVYFGLFKVIIS